MAEMDIYYRTGRWPGYAEDNIFDPRILLSFEPKDNKNNEISFLSFTEHIIMSGVLENKEHRLHWLEGNVSIPEELADYYQKCRAEEVRRARIYVAIRDTWNRTRRAVRAEIEDERLVINYSERESGPIFQIFYVNGKPESYEVKGEEGITSVFYGTVKLSKRMIISKKLVYGSSSI